MELLISKKEGLEEGVSSLRPLIRLKWADNIIGKDAAFHLQIQREQELENWANFCSLKTDFTNKLSHFSRRVPITTKSIVLHAEKHTDKLRYGFEAYWKKIKGSWIDIDEEPAVQNKVKTEVTGGKFSFNYEDEVYLVVCHIPILLCILCYFVSLVGHRVRAFRWWGIIGNFPRQFSTMGITYSLKFFQYPWNIIPLAARE